MNLLTVQEQIEILTYIRWKAGGEKPDFRKLPMWLVELEAAQHRVQRIAFGAFLAGFFVGGILMLAIVYFYLGVR